MNWEVLNSQRAICAMTTQIALMLCFLCVDLQQKKMVHLPVEFHPFEYKYLSWNFKKILDRNGRIFVPSKFQRLGHHD